MVVIDLININFLSDNEQIKIINEWFKIWQQKDNEKELKLSITTPLLPKTIIMKKDDVLIGFYQIIEHDNDHTLYTPWIANVFIDYKYRGCGYGALLIKSIPTMCKQLGIKEIYLHSRLQNFYEKFNFEYLQKLELNDDIKRNIYTRRIS